MFKHDMKEESEEFLDNDEESIDDDDWSIFYKIN